MRARCWSRFAVALLLLWQFETALALSVPQLAVVAHAGSVDVNHCAERPQAAQDAVEPAGAGAAPMAPDCCHHAASPCQCVQLPALVQPALVLGEMPPPDSPRLPRTAFALEARGPDLFRPPI